ncbi:viroplasmin family protein [Mycoplasma sp. SG1]|uniref:ribonuclease H1 domain-containing protein n=1 Tax=Mycoplasma sp. SG1 TaxID=2810348 RepID=UPI0020248353|nr:ribonuclease H family protein [Mycoplasma sp. SG1]URM53151.1 ribonuclease H family protein [Mycoplasma sp. SG1]
MKYYVVYVGKKTGIYNSWKECFDQVNGYPNAIYKSFKTIKEAEDSINNYLNTSPLSVQTIDDIKKRLEKYDLVFFIDGSFNKLTKSFTAGILILTNSFNNQLTKITIKKKFLHKFFSKHNNVAGELMAAVFAMKYSLLLNSKKTLICHDYIGISEFCKTWKSNNPMIKMYQDLFKQNFNNDSQIDFLKIKGHSDNNFLNLTDKLANEAHLNKAYSETIGVKNSLVFNFETLTDNYLKSILETNFNEIKIIDYKILKFKKHLTINYNNNPIHLEFIKQNDGLVYLNNSLLDKSKETKLISSWLFKNYKLEYHGVYDYFFINLDFFNTKTEEEIIKLLKNKFSENQLKTFYFTRCSKKNFCYRKFFSFKIIFCFFACCF